MCFHTSVCGVISVMLMADYLTMNPLPREEGAAGWEDTGQCLGPSAS